MDTAALIAGSAAPSQPPCTTMSPPRALRSRIAVGCAPTSALDRDGRARLAIFEGEGAFPTLDHGHVDVAADELRLEPEATGGIEARERSVRDEVDVSAGAALIERTADEVQGFLDGTELEPAADLVDPQARARVGPRAPSSRKVPASRRRRRVARRPRR